MTSSTLCLLFWAAQFFNQALLSPVHRNETLSPTVQAAPTSSGLREASTGGAVAAGETTTNPVYVDNTGTPRVHLTGGTQQSSGESTRLMSNSASPLTHKLLSDQVISGSTSMPAVTSASSKHSTNHSFAPFASTHAMFDVTHSPSHSTSGVSDSTHALYDLTHSTSNSTSGLPDSISTQSNLTHSTPHSTSKVSDTTQASFISTSMPTNSTNSSMGAVVPRKNSGNHGPSSTTSMTTKSSTTQPGGGNASGGDNPCSPLTPRRDGLVNQCLIAIASLAGVATIFIVCTIMLCTKLSAHKHRYRIAKSQSTEMVCISSLLPDGDVSHRRPRQPRSNGALIPNMEESDGDDLTLQSFLPENERPT